MLASKLELERLVEERTADLAAANQQLQATMAEKEDFLRAVSHDLNAPLRNIDGMVASVLRRGGDSLDSDTVRRLERVRANVATETELINEILELSRIRTADTEVEDVDVERVVWELRGMFESDLRENAIDLIVENVLPAMRADRTRVRQVFQNLIDNAIKYMGDGVFRQVAVACDVDRSGATFTVRDTGQGVPDDMRERLFYAFRRGDHHAAIPGKGVGLAGVKAIVETWGGSITCEPNTIDDRGTLFRVFVPSERLVRPSGNVFSVQHHTPIRREQQKERAA